MSEEAWKSCDWREAMRPKPTGLEAVKSWFSLLPERAAYLVSRDGRSYYYSVAGMWWTRNGPAVIVSTCVLVAFLMIFALLGSA